MVRRLISNLCHRVPSTGKISNVERHLMARQASLGGSKIPKSEAGIKNVFGREEAGLEFHSWEDSSGELADGWIPLSENAPGRALNRPTQVAFVRNLNPVRRRESAAIRRTRGPDPIFTAKSSIRVETHPTRSGHSAIA